MAKEVNDVRTRQDERRYYNPVQKDAATFLKTSEETEGEYTLMEIEIAPGGTKPHYHKTYTESFEVIEGSLGSPRRRSAVLPACRGEGRRPEEHAAPLPQRHGRDGDVPVRDAPRPARVREHLESRIRPRERWPHPLRRDPEEPLPHGVAPRMVGDTGTRHLHPHRTDHALPGEAGPAEGD